MQLSGQLSIFNIIHLTVWLRNTKLFHSSLLIALHTVIVEQFFGGFVLLEHHIDTLVLLLSATRSPLEKLISDWRYDDQLRVRADIVVPRIFQSQQKLLKCVCVEVHLILLFNHFVLLIVNQLLDALEIGKVYLLVDFNETLQA